MRDSKAKGYLLTRANKQMHKKQTTKPKQPKNQNHKQTNREGSDDMLE